MHLHLSHNNSEARRLPKGIYDYLKKRFLLKDDYVKRLRCFEYAGAVGEKQVTRVTIFSLDDIMKKYLEIKNRSDLEKYRDLILFEGYIDTEGKAYAADRRTPKTAVKVKRK